MRRRDFLKLMGTGAAGASLLTACRIGDKKTEFEVESPAEIPADTPFGSDAWYASVCTGCPSGCGVIVRVFEGRAKKLEGNPNHPVNQGKLCAVGQAQLQDLYHPDRIASPLKRSGDRGSGNYTPISWDEALDELGSRLRDLNDAGRGNEVVMLTEPMSGAARSVADRFMTGLGGQRLSFDPLDQSVLREALRRVFGTSDPASLPTFDISNASFLLSFGADFLHSWIAPVHYSVAWGRFRRKQDGSRGTHVHFEPRMSGTAASADLWVPVTPGGEGALALAIARAIVDEGLAQGDASTIYGDLLANYAPEQVADATGVPANHIRAIARRFASQQPALAIGGGSAGAQTNGLFNLTAVYALNRLVGNVNQPGGVLLPGVSSPTLAALLPDAAPSLSAWSELQARMTSGAPTPVDTLLIHGANPIYGLPREVALTATAALLQTPNIISFSRYLDETTVYADLILPDHSGLESWGAVVPQPGLAQPVVGFQQPVVPPFYDTRAFPDVLLTVAEEIGGNVLNGLPWDTFEAAVHDLANQLQQQGGGNIEANNPSEYWVNLLQQGVWTGAASDSQSSPSGAIEWPQHTDAEFPRPSDQFPLHLLPYPSATLGAGQAAYLPWMQALPDPITTGVWASWVELNPATADDLGVGTGDLVRVVSTHGEAEMPAYVNPSTPPDIAAVPMGQGHAFYGRYAEGRGVNALSLVGPQSEQETGGLAWAATMARVEKTGRKGELPLFEGSARPTTPDGYDIVRLEKRRL
jgi:anaerobic selenocysteine-containing dehydrogenase